MIKSLCLGLGRNTPAPKRSISNLPAPVAIISIAQQASPNVMGQSADLRAQLTTGAAMSTVFAPTVRRIEFIIESTVVKTKPSSCSAINLGPLQRALAPGIVVTDNKDRDEDKHFDERERRKRKVVAHEDDCPGEQENCFDVENQEEHRDDVVAHGKPLVRLGRRVDAALVRPHLALLVFDRAEKAAENDRQNRKDYSYAEKHHHRPVSCYRAADSLSCSGRYRLKKHH